MTTGNNRKIYLDVIRIVAIFWVIYFEGITFLGYTVDYLNVSTYMTAIFVFVFIKWIFNEKLHINNNKTIKVISCLKTIL